MNNLLASHAAAAITDAFIAAFFVHTAPDAAVKESKDRFYFLHQTVIWLVDWFKSNQSAQVALWAASRSRGAKLFHTVSCINIVTS